MTIEVLTSEVDNIKKEHDKCENRQKEKQDDLQDQINEQEVKQSTDKRKIYDHVNEIEKKLMVEIGAVAKDVRDTKWSIVKWLFIAMGGSALLQGVINKIFTLGG